MVWTAGHPSTIWAFVFNHDPYIYKGMPGPSSISFSFLFPFVLLAFPKHNILLEY